MDEAKEVAAQGEGGAPGVGEDALRSPSGLLFRLMRPGEIIQDGDYAWVKGGSIAESDPIPAGASIGRTITEDLGNNYYRLLTAPTPPAPAPVGAEVEELVKALEAAAWACKLGYQLLEITGLDSKDRIEAHKKMFDAHCYGVATLSRTEGAR